MKFEIYRCGAIWRDKDGKPYVFSDSGYFIRLDTGECFAVAEVVTEDRCTIE